MQRVTLINLASLSNRLTEKSIFQALSTECLLPTKGQAGPNNRCERDCISEKRYNEMQWAQFTRDWEGRDTQAGSLQTVETTSLYLQAMADQKKSKFHQPEGAQHSRSHAWFRCAFMTWVVLNPRKV